MLNSFLYLIPFFYGFYLLNTLLVVAVFLAPQPHFNDNNDCKGLNDDGAGQYKLYLLRGWNPLEETEHICIRAGLKPALIICRKHYVLFLY